MKKSLLILPFALIAAALALTACGGGGSSSSGGGEDEAAIEETIEKAATTTDPSKCTEFQTVKLNEQETGETGKKATEVCEVEAGEQEAPAESVDVSNVSVDGETATAQAAVHGSALDGQTVELELAKEGGKWKLNGFVEFVKFDAALLGESFEKEFSGSEEVSAPLAKCISGGVAELSQSEAEAVVFESDFGTIEKLVEKCQ